MMDWSGSVNRHREFSGLQTAAASPHASEPLQPPLFVKVRPADGRRAGGTLPRERLS